MNFARSSHKKARERQIRAGNCRKRTEVAGIIRSRLLKILQRIFITRPRVQVPGMPAATNHVFGLWYFQKVTKSRPADDPVSMLFEEVLELVHRGCDGVSGDMHIPSLPNQLLVLYQLSVIFN